MKYLFILLITFATTLSWACNEELEDEPATFARKYEDPTGLEVLIFYPYEVEGANISSVSILVYQNKKLSLAVDASVREVFATEHKLDPKIYRFSYLVLENASVTDIKVTLSYSYPPNEDGSVIMCGPMRQFELGKIIE